MSTIRMRAAALALTLASAGAAALAGCATSQAVITRPVPSSSVSAEQALATIVRLAAERVMTADTVAAAKWGTTQPIDEPAREKTVLNGAVAEAGELGIDQATVQRIFRDQIAANKDVQRALYAQWQAHPAEQPTRRPDLVTQVRPVLDRVDSQLLTVIRQAQPVLSRPDCAALLEQGRAATVRAMRLDRIHRIGLDQATARTCRPR